MPKSKLVKRFKSRSRTQQFMFLGMGLVFLIVIASFAGLFGIDPYLGYEQRLGTSLTPSNGGNYNYGDDVIIRAVAEVTPAGDESLIQLTVSYMKVGAYSPTPLYHKTWTASANEQSEVYQRNMGKLAVGTYKVYMYAKASASLQGGDDRNVEHTFTVSSAPVIQWFDPDLNEVLELTTSGKGATTSITVVFNAVEGSSDFTSITARIDSNSIWSESSNFKAVTYRPSLQIKSAADEDGGVTGHTLYVTLKDSVGNEVTGSRAFSVKWSYPTAGVAGGGGFEAPSFTGIFTFMSLGFLLLFKKFIYKSRWR